MYLRQAMQILYRIPKFRFTSALRHLVIPWKLIDGVGSKKTTMKTAISHCLLSSRNDITFFHSNHVLCILTLKRKIIQHVLSTKYLNTLMSKCLKILFKILLQPEFSNVFYILQPKYFKHSGGARTSMQPCHFLPAAKARRPIYGANGLRENKKVTNGCSISPSPCICSHETAHALQYDTRQQNRTHKARQCTDSGPYISTTVKITN